MSPAGRTVGLVLAAGAGRRFGGPKALVRFEGERLVDRAVRILSDGGCAAVLVVSGAVDLEVDGADVVPNPLWETGMGSSLQVGLAALAALAERGELAGRPGIGGAEAAVVLLVDTPWVSPDAVRRVREAGATWPAAIATYAGRRGHPVLLAAGVWAEVAASAHDDVAAKAWLQAHPDRVLQVDCSGLGDPRDIDRPADLST